jgi:hypothetical protein
MNRLPRRRGAPVSGSSLVSWLWRPAGRLPQVGWGDIALAAVLSAFAIVLATGLAYQPPGPRMA